MVLFSANSEHAIRHMPSGQLGQLVFYKSGKVKVRVGDSLLDLNDGVQCAFHQELYSIQINPTTNTQSAPAPDMNNAAFRLGEISHRYVCSLDVNSLINSYRQASK
jgi:DNA-directed RNA polymerase III subunit RPC4